MYKIDILDQHKPIVMLKWSGVIGKEEALAVIPDLLAVGDKVGGKFYFLVDLTEMKLSNIVAEFAEHQRATLHMIHSIAVVNTSPTNKLMVRKMAQASNNDKESFFESYDEALAWLKKQ